MASPSTVALGERGGSTPAALARDLRARGAPGLLLFDGACAPTPATSILTAHPATVLTEHEPGRFVLVEPGGPADPIEDPIAWMSRRYEQRASAHPSELPFLGGLAGALGFELAWALDDVRAPRPPALTPALWVGDYPAALVHDHATGQWWLTGDVDSRAATALLEALEGASSAASDLGSSPPPTAPLQMVRPEADRAAAYRRGVAACVEAIAARGELFEVNYAERFATRWPGDPFALYERLRAGATGAFFGFLDAQDFQIASVSPERFLSVEGRRVCARPIKGSRRRAEGDPARDRALAEELLSSAKDRAENIMIVDLMRNDLTQVCRLGSVRAEAICELESFAGIHHLVSTVTGELEPGFGPLDALLACFPAGSITGAPKLRSIETIAQLEGSGRGAYTGSLFYASRHGRLDSSVLIRTAEIVGDQVRYGAGGAVVADSDPELERREALLKVGPLARALGQEELR